MTELTSPRFASDGEAEDDEAKKIVKEELKSVKKWDATGVDVDARMLEGRKAARGFTVAMGKTTAENTTVADLRKGKRAQTLPAANMRRGDHILTPESQKALFDMNETLKARYRRGSVGLVSITTLKDEELEAVWKENTDGHTHGLLAEGQAHGDERDPFFCGMEASAYPRGNPPIISCQKGCKGFRDTTPNQDNFSVTYFKTGHTLACAFDGHGPFGHIVSTRAVQTVPYFFFKSAHYNQDPPNVGDALIEAFELSQKELVMHSLENSWDVQASGSTAVAAVWKDNTVWTANAGDSRCVIGSETNRKMVFETEDHKPNSEKEKARIEASGGEVRTQTYPDGWVNHRIFVKGEDYPGLCMARTLGDQSVKEHGVVATPEIATTEINMAEQPFILLASDGVWEFLDSEFVVKAVAKKIKTDGPVTTVKKLQREAKKRWKAEEGDYCDDITSVLVQLGPRDL